MMKTRNKKFVQKSDTKYRIGVKRNQVRKK